ncbi:MAG: ThuA domain-containing protein [Planctomycetota bacterium]|nr:ThuA domain-containing protein [Planctomycetota bacterium]
MRLRCWPRVWMMSAIVILFGAMNGWQTSGAADIPEADMTRIEEALPQEPTMQPRETRTLLIFSLCKGYRHGAIPWGVAALRRMGEKTGAYEAVVSDDVAMFEKENLARFDAVVFNNTTGTLFEDPALKTSLIDWVKAGGGVVGIHAATDCFYDWPEFGRMMGGYFHGHPWHEEVTLRIDDPDHPVNAAFEGEPLVITDEIYQFKDPYSREALRVLLSLDTIRTDMAKKGIHRDDGDFAVSWVRSYDKGRVFYCSLGHRNEIFWNPKVLQHYLDGIQFALGDLPADTTPSAELVGPGGDVMPLEEALRKTAEYEFGESRLPLTAVAAHVRYALDHPGERGPVVQGLLDLLASDSSTVDAKAFACRQLALVGGDESVAALAALLDDERLSHMARYALEGIPRDAAAGALRNALHRVSGELRIGIINSIGERGDIRAVPMLRHIATDDRATMLAVIAALGKIGDQAAFDLLAELAVFADEHDVESARIALLEALIPFAERFDRQRQPARAAAIYRHLFDEAHPRQIRTAGLRGLARVQPMQAVALVSDMLKSDDPRWRGTAARLVVQMPGEEVTKALANRADVLSGEAQVRLIDALAERGDKTARPAVTALIERADRDARRAAVEALGELGNASSVALLASLAATPEGDCVEEARASLDRLQGEHINAAIASLMKRASPHVRCELARSLGARGATGHVPALLELAAGDGEGRVHLAALGALKQIAQPRHEGQLVRLLVNATTDEQREASEEALIAACLRSEDVSGRAEPVVAAMPEADVPTKRSLIRVLARLAGPTALKAVRGAVNDEETIIADTALGALTGWPDAGAAEPLLDIAANSPDPVHHESAYRGYLRVISLPDDRDPAETVRMHEDALEVAEGDEEVRLALTSLGKVGHPKALELAEQYLEGPTVRERAASAMISIARRLDREHEAEALDAVDRALAACGEDETIREEAGEAVNHLQRDEDFIISWAFSGPYTREKHGGGALFDVAFDPEENPGEVAWREMPEEALSSPGIYDLNKVVSGSNCCGYVMAIIESDRAQQALLEMGSDDGLKAWLNGNVVHANNVMRGLSRGSDTTTVTLEEGTNRLLLKITQGGGDWKVCCRIRSVDGFALEGVSFRTPQ